MLKQVEIFTDGSCLGNPGPGGYGAILRYRGREKTFSAGYTRTTNNRMELFAAIQGLSALKESCVVNLYSDSSYLVNAFEKQWIEKWQRNGWKTSTKSPVENQDLWKLLLIHVRKHQVRFIKVKGHSDNQYNNRCDEMAVAAIKNGRGQISS